MPRNKNEKDFFIFVSHRNPEREAIIKTRRLYELVPEIDGIITPPFHEEIGAEQMSNKGLFVMQILELDNLDNCIYNSNYREFKNYLKIITEIMNNNEYSFTIDSHSKLNKLLEGKKISYLIEKGKLTIKKIAKRIYGGK